MRPGLLLPIITLSILVSCKKETAIITTDPPPPAVALLKDIVVSHLPSPYYHFEYSTTGRIVFASFASDFTRYEFVYQGDRLTEMRNNILVNKDRLEYNYDNAGRVQFIQYKDSTGEFFAESFFSYDGSKLVKVERFHKRQGPGTVTDRVMTLTYDANGNLYELTDHRPATDDGQVESTTVDRFEQYDDKVNVDAFSLLHPDFFEHLYLLPVVQLQKNNPGKETRTGDGINYQVDYTYTYSAKNVPLTKTGDAVFTNGNDVGKRFQTSTVYSYY